MSDYSYDSTGVKLDGGSRTIPESTYTFRITKAKPTKSKKGYFMVECECDIINNIDFMGKRLKHWVTFMPPEHKAAGIAIHFLKVIGQPWEGKFDVVAANWEGCTFIGKTKNEAYTSTKDGKQYEQSKIAVVEYLPGKKDSEIPF